MSPGAAPQTSVMGRNGSDRIEAGRELTASRSPYTDAPGNWGLRMAESVRLCVWAGDAAAPISELVELRPKGLPEKLILRLLPVISSSCPRENECGEGFGPPTVVGRISSDGFLRSVEKKLDSRWPDPPLRPGGGGGGGGGATARP